MDNLNFNDFLEESDDKFNSSLVEWKERLMIDAIKTNYDVIAKNGIDLKYVEQMTIVEYKSLVETLEVMLEYFKGKEEYEKCGVIFKHLKGLKELNSQTQDI